MKTKISIGIFLGVLYGVCCAAQSNPAQPGKATVATSDGPAQKLAAFFLKLPVLCKRHHDDDLKPLLADNLKNNQSFLKEWEFGLNNADAQIWQALSGLSNCPYTIDSSNRAKITALVPNIKTAHKVPNSLGVLYILPQPYLPGFDTIYAKPSENSATLGMLHPGETYTYFTGTAGYSASLKQYITDAFNFEGEGDGGYFAIELDPKQHKLGYIAHNGTSASLPIMHLQYLNGSWKISGLTYPSEL